MTDIEQPVVYDVSTTEHRLAIRAGQSSGLSFTITNQSSTARTTGIKVRAEGDLRESWCQLDGPAVRELAPNDGVRCTLRVTVPDNAPAGSSKVTLTAYSVDDPETVFTRGAWVQIDHQRPGPKWIVPALIAAGVVIVGLLVWALWPKGAPPTVTITATPLRGFAPLEVQFAATASEPPDGWSWSFGDSAGTTSNEQNPAHEFKEPGSYRVQVTASYGDQKVLGLEAVGVERRVDAEMTVLNDTGSSPLEVRFVDRSVGAESRSWDFGDGSPPSSEPETTHTYTLDSAVAQTFTVKLTAQGPGEGNVDEDTHVVTVVPPGKASFALEPAIGYAPLQIRCTDASVAATGWSWDFGGNGTSSEQNPTFTFAQPGAFVVKLKIASGETAERKVTVHTRPKLVFNARPTEIVRESSVTFTWDISGDALSATLETGDGTSLPLVTSGVGVARRIGERTIKRFQLQPKGSRAYAYPRAGKFEARLVVNGRVPGEPFTSIEKINVKPKPGELIFIDTRFLERTRTVPRLDRIR